MTPKHEKVPRMFSPPITNVPPSFFSGIDIQPDDDPETVAAVQAAGQIARDAVPYLKRMLSVPLTEGAKVALKMELPTHVKPFVIGYCADKGVAVQYARGDLSGDCIVTLSQRKQAGQ